MYLSDGRFAANVPLIERVRASSDVADECWTWAKKLDKLGNPRMTFRGSAGLVARFVYLDQVDPIPDGHAIGRSCGNRQCVRPGHLEVISMSEVSREREKRGARKSTAVSRFRARYEVIASGCWAWRGAITSDGYGTLSDQGVTVYAHRLSYAIMNGPIPEGLVIDHLCRMRDCVNPEHLEAVTNAENVRRGESGKRTRPRVP